jgi:fido (protein-threonine AMPylation protein)
VRPRGSPARNGIGATIVVLHWAGATRQEHPMTEASQGHDDPREHTRKIKSMLRETMEHVRQDVPRVSDPKAQALFETSAEVLGGLITAYEHFEQRSEAAWR